MATSRLHLHRAAGRCSIALLFSRAREIPTLKARVVFFPRSFRQTQDGGAPHFGG